MPKSPYSADVLSFVRKAVNGENIQKAALSAAGNLVMKRIEKQAGPIFSKIPMQRESYEFQRFSGPNRPALFEIDGGYRKPGLSESERKRILEEEQKRKHEKLVAKIPITEQNLRIAINEAQQRLNAAEETGRAHGSTPAMLAHLHTELLNAHEAVQRSLAEKNGEAPQIRARIAMLEAQIQQHRNNLYQVAVLRGALKAKKRWFEEFGRLSQDR